MMRDLSRLMNPRSIAVIGGGTWCASIIGAAKRIGFEGDIFAVHPDGKEIAGQKSLRCLRDWSGPIDAAFVGINRHATVETVRMLAERGAGGAVCFASGFSETGAEDAGGAELQAKLVRLAGDMPVLGPNCYGFVNALDRVAIWPDQHGMVPVDRGVAILTQSSNIAINLTMQSRGLPIAFMVTCGNMAQTSQAVIASALLDDDRITAIGLHVEGFGDLREWEALAQKAYRQSVPLIALKVGRSVQARSATVSHTASLAGGDAGAQAFLDRLGIARLGDLPVFLETLKLLHCTGPLASNRIASISCSGGEASLIADLACDHDVVFAPMTQAREDELRAVLGPMVSLTNPLDYHTYIWRDTEAMTRAWAAMSGADTAITLSIVDYPATQADDWACATDAALQVRAGNGAPFAVVSSLPELMPGDVAEKLQQGGVVPLNGLNEALAAVAAVARLRVPDPVPVTLPHHGDPGQILSEAEAKVELARFGLAVPAAGVARDPAEAVTVATGLTAPLVLKGLGLAHKTENGAVRVGLGPGEIENAAREIGTQEFLVEEMVRDGVAELLIGVTLDPAHGFVLTLGAGGVLTEIMGDSVSMLVPSWPEEIRDALKRLRSAPLLAGYRGQQGVDMGAVVQAIVAVQDYVLANSRTIVEVEINPLICTPERAVAVDALIRKAAL
jgi:acyl-CoA synthetase (NDP forming)